MLRVATRAGCSLCVPRRGTVAATLSTTVIAASASACTSSGGGAIDFAYVDAGDSDGAIATISPGTGSSGGPDLVDDAGTGGLQLLDGSANRPVADSGRRMVCTDAGCTCVRIASIGHEGIWGACGVYGDNTSAFQTWLNTQSTATVDSYRDTKPTLTAAFLAQYDVILLQWLRDVSPTGDDGNLWVFSPDEVNALAAWVRGGGGIISLSGYDGDGQEVAPLNTLLSFTDFTYNMDATEANNCSACWGGACPISPWNAGSPIGAHLQQIGVQFGRSIAVASDAGSGPTVDCPCPGGQACAAHEDIGKGHVFAFTDEWVTYTSQWLGTATCIAASCTGNTPADVFQVPQFWYNAIKYASSGASCFVIQNPTVLQ
jgi:hypothetical protein